MLYSMRNILRLCRKQTFLQNKRFNPVRASSRVECEQNLKKDKDFAQLLDKYKDKIKFNSYLEHEKLEVGPYRYYIKNIKKAKIEKERNYKIKSLPPLPVALQYYVEKDQLLQDDSANITQELDKEFQLPFGNTSQIQYEGSKDNIPKTNTVTDIKHEDEEFDRSDINKWMTNYEYFDDTKINEQLDNEDNLTDGWSKYYGTPDPTVGVSRVPCGGCGALLHCSDPAIPGYLPSEIFKGREIHELKLMECQRCHFLKEYNIALDITVHPEEYEKLLQSIRNVKSLVLLMVDLLDFPCSIWPGIVDIIGTDRPIIIVGNKVDLLPGDSVGYLKRIKHSLLNSIKTTRLAEANIKHVALVSAKTGYGVEDLISAMFKLWLYKGDVFLVGCTNVGKSSLFNALLQSDYCKVHAIDIIKRATVSRWPGTTLNLLKFPINRPSGWKIYNRTRRLLTDRKLMKIEKQIRSEQLQGRVPNEAPALIGRIGRSFSEFDERNDMSIAEKKMMVLDEKNKLFSHSKWFYDTPGVIHPDQVLSLLSTEELLLTIPKKLIRPQTFYLHRGSSLFIGGLARIDFVDCEEPCRFTVFCSESLPVTIVQTENADEIYDTFIGTELFAAPTGGRDRLKNWPGLKSAEILEFAGEGPKICCGDIVLSSVAWMGVTAKMRTVCSVRAWTPEGRGVYKRYPSVLPFSINLKGKRVPESPAYLRGKVFSDEE